MKKKAKKIFIFLVFLVPLLYFAFTVLFFSPFEDPFGPVEYIIPRDVDIYLCKVDLADDFAGFPVPAFYLDLKVNQEWREFSGSPLFKELSRGRQPEEVAKKIREEIRDLPLDPLADVLGRQAAFAGTFDGEGIPSSYLVFFRGSWKAKLLFELLTWDFIRRMVPDPLLSDSTVEFDPRGFITLVLSDGRTFYLKRCADLIIAGNDERLMEATASLVDLGKDSIDLSLGGSQSYREKIGLVDHEGRDLVDFHVDLDSFFKQVAFDDRWKGDKIDFSVMTAVQIFDPDFFHDLTGTLDLDPTLRLDARSSFHKKNVMEAKTGFFDQESIDLKESMDDLAAMLPPDVFVAGCAKLDLQPFLEILERNLNPDLRALINDLVREGGRRNVNWKLSGTWEFIDFLDRTFGSKVRFALRPRAKDKPIKPFEQPLPIIALILEVEDQKRLALLEDVVINLQDSRRQSFDMSKLSGDWYGCDIKIIDPKGAEDLESITYTTMGERYFVIATSLDFIEDIVRAWARPEKRLELAGNPLYRRAAAAFPKYGNLAAYVEMDGLKRSFDDYAVYWAHLQIEQTPEAMRAERERMKKRLARGGAKATGEKLEEMVDKEMQRLMQQRIDEEVPGYTAAFRGKCAWMRLLRSIALAVNVNVHDVDLSLGVETALERKRGGVIAP